MDDSHYHRLRWGTEGSILRKHNCTIYAAKLSDMFIPAPKADSGVFPPAFEPSRNFDVLFVARLRRPFNPTGTYFWLLAVGTFAQNNSNSVGAE